MILPYRDPFPVQRLLVAIGAAVWLGASAVELSAAVSHPDKVRIFVAAACIALPFAVLYAGRLPMYLVAVYAALVPFTELLDTAGGGTLTKMLGIAAGGAVLLSIAGKMRVVPPSRPVLVLVALTAYVGMTVCWAIDSTAAFGAYLVFLSYIGLYVAIAFYPATEKEVWLVVWATVGGAFASAAYGGYLFLHGQGVFESRLGIGNATSWIDPNEYAAALLTPLAMVLMAMLGARRIATKSALLVVLLISVYGFAASGSRGGMFAVGAMLLFLTIRSRYRVQLLAIVPVLAVAIMGSPIGHRLMQPDFASADLRTDIWKIGIASLHQYWLAGAGIGNFTNAYVQYFLSTPHAALSWDRVAHSIVIQSAVEYGVPGLVLVLVLWYAQFDELRKTRVPESMRDLSLALQAAVLGLFVSGLSLNLMLAKYTWLAFSIIALVRAASMKSQISADSRSVSPARAAGPHHAATTAP